MRPFTHDMPLPAEGTFTVLEASAGTGKTYAITGLACRLLAEGRITMDQLLLITFTRNSAAELRDRLHQRLTEAVAALANTSQEPTDDVLRALCHCPDRTARRERLHRALTDFDAAVIATIHQACSRMLADLGILVDHDHSSRPLTDLTGLTGELTVDAYLEMFSASSDPELDLFSARRMTAALIDQPDLSLVPENPSTPQSAARVAFARAVRRRLDEARNRDRFHTFHDMQARLRDALVDPDTGPQVADQLSHRFRAVLVDEFQDTDPVQWEILRRTFLGRSTMIVIGDPKQAIYGFRGGDVHTYLAAVADADPLTLTQNRRTDTDLLESVGALFHQAHLGHPRIAVTPVSGTHTRPRLHTTDRPMTPLLLHRAGDETEQLDRGAAHARVATDVAHWISRALGGDITLDTPGGARPLAPSDIAVLVRASATGERVLTALQRIGVPAAMAGAGSVLKSAAAEDWSILLEALVSPGSAQIRALTLTSWFGWTTDDVARADDAAFDRITGLVREWSQIAHQQGVAALSDAITASTGYPEDLLARVGGERQVTDLRHIGTLLATEESANGWDVMSLRRWFEEYRLTSSRVPPEHLSQLLETDDAAVRIGTIHSAKGLEFPVVLLPDLWDTAGPQSIPLTAMFTREGQRWIDVGGETDDGHADNLAAYRAESQGEELRLAYVAATRARSHLGLWWAPVLELTERSSLHRLLATSEPACVPPPSPPLQAATHGVQRLLDAGGRVLGLTHRGDPVPEEQPADDALRARSFHRAIDTGWRRTSYSGLTQEAHDATPRLDDEPEVATRADGDEEPVSPMSSLPMGARFGTVVHALYEEVDFASPTLEQDLLTTAADLLERFPVDCTPSELATGLAASIETPLGPLVGNRRLRDLAPGDRLNELDFELAVAPRSAPGRSVDVTAIAATMARHLGPDDPLHNYPARLADLPVTDGTLRGYLTGSIDLVLRVDGRFVISDYKTNWLSTDTDGPLTLAGYRPSALAEAMMAAHYPLQATLYSVALHRFLRWRLPDYDPALHLGGVLYLFVRGMAGPMTPREGDTPYGVFSWSPPAAMTVDLSDLLSGGIR